MKSGWWALTFLLVAGSVAAQEPQITPDTSVDSATLEKWLHSDDPRLIAWAADFARRNPDPKILAELPALFDHWSIPLDYGYTYSDTLAPQARAGLAILDALIESRALVPARTIHAIAPAFPVQAAILIGYLPIAESHGTLHDWTYGSTGYWAELLARVASMMLARDPHDVHVVRNHEPIGFVANVVAAAETEVDLEVKPDNSPAEPANGAVICGDSFGLKSPPGWPDVYTYYVSENDARPDALAIVDLDGDRITSQRRPTDAGWGSCGGGVEPLDAKTRHRLIAHWLGVADKDMEWQAVQSVTIVWAGKADYERRTGEIVESQREKLRDTVKALQKRGFLTEGEATSVTPKLSVVVKCEIRPCPLDVH